MSDRSDRGIQFRSLTEAIDTATPGGGAAARAIRGNGATLTVITTATERVAHGFERRFRLERLQMNDQDSAATIPLFRSLQPSPQRNRTNISQPLCVPSVEFLVSEEETVERVAGVNSVGLGGLQIARLLPGPRLPSPTIGESAGRRGIGPAGFSWHRYQ